MNSAFDLKNVEATRRAPQLSTVEGYENIFEMKSKT